jgi:hypothetical protein
MGNYFKNQSNLYTDLESRNKKALQLLKGQSRRLDDIIYLAKTGDWRRKNLRKKPYKTLIQVTAFRYLFKIAVHHLNSEYDVLPKPLKTYLMLPLHKLSWVSEHQVATADVTTLFKYVGTKQQEKLGLYELYQVDISLSGNTFRSLYEVGEIPSSVNINHYDVDTLNKWICCMGLGKNGFTEARAIEFYKWYDSMIGNPPEPVLDTDSGFYKRLGALSALPLCPYLDICGRVNHLAPDLPWHTL